MADIFDAASGLGAAAINGIGSGINATASGAMGAAQSSAQFMFAPPVNPVAQAPGMNTAQFYTAQAYNNTSPLMLQARAAALGFGSAPQGMSTIDFTRRMQEFAELDRRKMQLSLHRNADLPFEAAQQVAGVGAAAHGMIGMVSETAASKLGFLAKPFQIDWTANIAKGAAESAFVFSQSMSQGRNIFSAMKSAASPLLSGVLGGGDIMDDTYANAAVKDLYGKELASSFQGRGVLGGIANYGITKATDAMFGKRPEDFLQRTAFDSMVSQNSHMFRAYNPQAPGGRGFTKEQFGGVYNQMANMAKTDTDFSTEDYLQQFGSNMASGKYFSANNADQLKEKVAKIKDELKFLKNMAKTTGEAASSLRQEMSGLEQAIGAPVTPNLFNAYKFGGKALGAVSGMGETAITQAGLQSAQMFSQAGYSKEFGFVTGQRMAAMAGMTEQRGRAGLSEENWNAIGGVAGVSNAMQSMAVQVNNSAIGSHLAAGLAKFDANGNLSIDQKKLAALKSGAMSVDEVARSGAGLMNQGNRSVEAQMKFMSQVQNLQQQMPGEEPAMFMLRAAQEQVLKAAPSLKGKMDEQSKAAVAFGVTKVLNTQGFNYNQTQVTAMMDTFTNRDAAEKMQQAEVKRQALAAGVEGLAQSYGANYQAAAKFVRAQVYDSSTGRYVSATGAESDYDMRMRTMGALGKWTAAGAAAGTMVGGLGIGTGVGAAVGFAAGAVANRASFGDLVRNSAWEIAGGAASGALLGSRLGIYGALAGGVAGAVGGLVGGTVMSKPVNQDEMDRRRQDMEKDIIAQRTMELNATRPSWMNNVRGSYADLGDSVGGAVRDALLKGDSRGAWDKYQGNMGNNRDVPYAQRESFEDIAGRGRFTRMSRADKFAAVNNEMANSWDEFKGNVGTAAGTAAGIGLVGGALVGLGILATAPVSLTTLAVGTGIAVAGAGVRYLYNGGARAIRTDYTRWREGDAAAEKKLDREAINNKEQRAAAIAQGYTEKEVDRAVDRAVATGSGSLTDVYNLTPEKNAEAANRWGSKYTHTESSRFNADKIVKEAMTGGAEGGRQLEEMLNASGSLREMLYRPKVDADKGALSATARGGATELDRENHKKVQTNMREVLGNLLNERVTQDGADKGKLNATLGSAINRAAADKTLSKDEKLKAIAVAMQAELVGNNSADAKNNLNKMAASGDAGLAMAAGFFSNGAMTGDDNNAKAARSAFASAMGPEVLAYLKKNGKLDISDDAMSLMKGAADQNAATTGTVFDYGMSAEKSKKNFADAKAGLTADLIRGMKDMDPSVQANFAKIALNNGMGLEGDKFNAAAEVVRSRKGLKDEYDSIKNSNIPAGAKTAKINNLLKKYRTNAATIKATQALGLNADEYLGREATQKYLDTATDGTAAGVTAALKSVDMHAGSKLYEGFMQSVDERLVSANEAVMNIVGDDNKAADKLSGLLSRRGVDIKNAKDERAVQRGYAGMLSDVFNTVYAQGKKGGKSAASRGQDAVYDFAAQNSDLSAAQIKAIADKETTASGKYRAISQIMTAVDVNKAQEKDKNNQTGAANAAAAGSNISIDKIKNLQNAIDGLTGFMKNLQAEGAPSPGGAPTGAGSGGTSPKPK